jgi:hypothetical protein
MDFGCCGVLLEKGMAAYSCRSICRKIAALSESRQLKRSFKICYLSLWLPLEQYSAQD